MTRTAFEQIVQEEFERLPEMFRQHLENVHIQVADAPSEAQLEHVGDDGEGDLLGLYEGIPLTDRGTGYGSTPVVPDTITLFQRSLEAISETESELREEIRTTLIHEIAHYYGMDEDDIERAGYA